MKYLIGTRGSHLSIAQTKWVISELQKQNPDDSFEIVTITTKGDTDARPLFTIDQKGIFEKEVDRAVSEKRVHFAVHSLKDVPTEISADLIIACIPKREKVNDILISKKGDTLDSLPTDALIGTSSLRRAVQISRKRPDIKVKPIRGNIETRVRKVTEGEFDGVILAIAGIIRLGLNTQHSILSTDDLSPSPGQGALAIVCRKDDSQTTSMLKKIEDNTSRWEIEAERALSKYVDSGCRFPIGAYAKSYGESMTLKVSAFSVDGQKSVVVQKSGPRDDPESLGRTVGKELQEKGIADLALNWREKVEEWNKQ